MILLPKNAPGKRSGQEWHESRLEEDAQSSSPQWNAHKMHRGFQQRVMKVISEEIARLAKCKWENVIQLKTTQSAHQFAQQILQCSTN